MSPRKARALVSLLTRPSLKEAAREAEVGEVTLWRWMQDATFKEELRKQRDAVITEALESLKGNMTRATEALIGLLTTQNEALRRHVANDVIGHVLKARELTEIEQRLDQVERLVQEGRTQR